MCKSASEWWVAGADVEVRERVGPSVWWTGAGVCEGHDRGASGKLLGQIEDPSSMAECEAECDSIPECNSVAFGAQGDVDTERAAGLVDLGLVRG